MKMTVTNRGVATINNNEYKVVEKTGEYVFENLEPSTGTTPYKKVTQTTLYKNGNLFDKCTATEYFGNWEGKNKPQNTKEYELNTDSKTFHDLVYKVMEQYY